MSTSVEKDLITHLTSNQGNFYFMINPYFPTPAMFEAIKNNVSHLVKYYSSDQKTIGAKIKQLEKVDLPLAAVNGSCEAIRIFLQNFAKKVLVTVPNFNEWEITDHINIAYNASAEEIRQAIRANNVDTVCFCNPNNPTGYYRDDIEGLAQEFPNVNFVIDNSFIDFAAEEIPPPPQGRNIVLVKSLGKKYGICGARLGYLASANEELVNDFIKRLPIWNISSLAEFILDLMISDPIALAAYEESRLKTIVGTRKMFALLKKFDYLEVYPSWANFIMVKSTRPLNFKVKSCANKTGLDGNYYRIAYNEDLALLENLLSQN